MDPTINLMIGQAIQAFQNGNFVVAESILNALLKTNRNNLPALQILGLIKASQGKPQEAANFLKKAVSLNPKDVSLQFNLAKALSESGNDKEALTYHLNAIRLDGKNREILLNYGKSLASLRRYDDALIQFDLILSQDPVNIEALINKALSLSQLKDFESAILIFRRVLNINPKTEKAILGLGETFLLSGQPNEALVLFEEAIKNNPTNLLFWSNKGSVAIQLKDYVQALAAFDHALLLNPDAYEVLVNKGIALNLLGNYEQALTCFDKALIIKPHYVDALYNKGIVLHHFKNYDQAIALFDRALHLAPLLPVIWINKGITLSSLQKYEAAISHLNKAIDLDPNCAEALINKGIALHQLEHYEQAIECFDRALQIKPNYLEALVNMGLAYAELRIFDKAIKLYEDALRIQPAYAEAKLNKALIHLLQGDLMAAWKNYEARLNLSDKPVHAYQKDIPQLQNLDNIKDKHILVWADQGLGDSIQFCRYLPLLKALGAEISFLVPSPLVNLIGSLENAGRISDVYEPHSYDYQVALLSLPFIFNTNLFDIPARKPYLFADGNKVREWQDKLGTKTKKRIGIAWSSSSGFRDDKKRSLSLEQFSEILHPEEFEYICLQKEIKPSDQAFFERYQNVQFYGDELKDFADTAALIDCVDLVISTCTSIPHLSAALGKESWILLSYNPDWRWLLDRQDSPWYPSIKLYRQAERGDWESVFKLVNRDLQTI